VALGSGADPRSSLLRAQVQAAVTNVAEAESLGREAVQALHQAGAARYLAA
jgi:hypothetical protein